MAKPIKLRPKVASEKIQREKKGIFKLPYTKEERKVLKSKILEMYSEQFYKRQDIARILNCPTLFVQSIVKKVDSHKKLGITPIDIKRVIIKPKIISEKKQKAALVREINDLLLNKSLMDLKEIIYLLK